MKNPFSLNCALSRSRFAQVFSLLMVCCVALPNSALAQSSDDADVRYTVVAGDTLERITRQYLRGPRLTARLQRLNRVADPRRLRIGRQLRIPKAFLRAKPVILRVRNFSGPVAIDGRNATVGAQLAEGDLVQTGARGFVTFSASGAGRITLPSNSRARLLRASRYELYDLLDVDFEVLEGRSELSAPKLRDQERFRTRTPSAVTAVRGTAFRVSFDPASGRATTEVTEGDVAVANEESVQLAPAGFGVSALPAAIGPPEALLAAPEMRDPGAIQTEATLQFELVPMPGAIGYRVQLARDAGFLDMIAETVTQDTMAQFDSLENARYFVRSRAIAENGLEGLSETASFRRKRLAAEASAGESPLADGFLFTWAAEGEGTTYFAFQLWDKARPDLLVVDEVGLKTSKFTITDLDPGRYAWRVAAVQIEAEGLLKVWGPPQELLVSD